MTKQDDHDSMINMEIMHSVFGQNRLAMRDYINDFTVSSAELLKQIEQAIQNNNKKLAMDYLHQLKGPAGSSGFHKIYLLCEKAEKQIEKSDWHSVNKLYCEIDKALQKIQSELEKEFRNR